MNAAARPNNGRWKLILLAALFATPVILSTLLYTLDWRPQGAVNYGELVQPPRPLPAVGLRDVNGMPADLRGKWSLVYFAPLACAEPCRQSLYKMRQVHLAQGQERDRLQRVMIVGAKAPDWLASVHRDYPDLRILTGTPENITTLAQVFVLTPDDSPARLDRIYVVDPLGNLMMSYPVDADPSGMRKDLKRLLKISQVG